MINELEVTNWKTHKKSKFHFQKGVNVLIGVMGAGKSSAMDAISFALFGTFPALLSKRVNLAGLVSNRPIQASDAEVKLNFSIDENDYTVVRKIGGNGNSAKLDRNGSYLQTQPTKVTEEIENALKVDYDTFARVVYAEQNRLDYFLELAKGERKKQIDHMLGLDNFATAEENVTSLINNIKSATSYEEEALSRIDAKEIRDQQKNLEHETFALKKEQEKSEAEEQSIAKELEKENRELESAKKLIERKKQISEEAIKLQSKITTLTEEIKKIESLKIDEKKISDQRAALERREKEFAVEIDSLKKDDRVLSRKVAELEAEIKQNEKKLQEKDKLLAQIKGESKEKIIKEVEEHDLMTQKLNTEIATKKGKVSEINDWLKELGKHISKCPVCERELDPDLKDKLLSSKNAQRKTMESEIIDATKAVEKSAELLKRAVEKLNKIDVANIRLAEYADVDALLEKAKRELPTTQKEQKETTQKIDKLSKEYDLLKENISALKNDHLTIERKKTYEKEVKTATALLESKMKDSSSIDVDEKSIYQTQERITKRSTLLGELRSRVQGGKLILAKLEQQLKEKRKQIEELEAIEKRIAKHLKNVQNLNKFKTALVETETVLRNRLVSSINNLMQGIWGDLYPYGDYHSIRLSAKRDDYLLEVDTGIDGGNGTWMQVDGIASGGERSIACLTMRIALAMVVVPNLRWMILDEPTHNIDSSGISKLIEVLGDQLPKVVEQIFIITHDDSLRQINSAKVYQLERDKGANAPTSIVQV